MVFRSFRRASAADERAALYELEGGRSKNQNKSRIDGIGMGTNRS